MEKNKPVVPIDYFWLALLAFGGFGLELLLPMLEPSGPAWLHHVLTSILWCAVALILWQIGKRRYGYCIFKPTTRPSARQLAAALVLVAATIASVTWLWGGFKPVLEFRSAASVTSFVWQYIYYIFEAVLIFTTIAFGQKFGDGLTRKTSIPWGGLVLAFTWGLIHILTQDILTGLAAFLWSLAYGAVYVLCRKNPVYALPAIALMFIL